MDSDQKTLREFIEPLNIPDNQTCIVSMVGKEPKEMTLKKLKQQYNIDEPIVTHFSMRCSVATNSVQALEIQLTEGAKKKWF